MAYLRLVSNPDDDISLVRIINVPKRGIGDTTDGQAGGGSGPSGNSIYQVLGNLHGIEVNGRTRTALLIEFREDDRQLDAAWSTICR